MCQNIRSAGYPKAKLQQEISVNMVPNGYK